MDPVVLLELMALLTAANGTPVIAARLLGQRWAAPLDGGLLLADGRRLFGDSKTLRGIVLGVAATAVLAALLGYGAMAGAAFGAASLIGDLTSSFIKRRLGRPPSSRAVLLDQVPEALLPLLLASGRLDLSAIDIGFGVGVFTAASLIGSRLLYRLGIRNRPY
jgi:CDP-2,3-bis-(O-geranylgeranyl)-sn-glycerol synthase